MKIILLQDMSWIHPITHPKKKKKKEKTGQLIKIVQTEPAG